MDVSIELEREAVSSDSGAQSERPIAGGAPDAAGESENRERSAARSPIEEASFVVLESGRIRFFVRPRVEVSVPTSLEDVQTFALTMTPRGRDRLRRLAVIKNRLPDPTGRDMQWVVVDRVGSSNHVGEGTGVLEVASGTYAIASHRDHVHFLYELDLGSPAVPARLLRQLRIAPRTSYIAACPRWSSDRMHAHPTAVDAGCLRALDPTALDDEGTEFVLVSGGHFKVDPDTTWARLEKT